MIKSKLKNCKGIGFASGLVALVMFGNGCGNDQENEGEDNMPAQTNQVPYVPPVIAPTTPTNNIPATNNNPVITRGFYFWDGDSAEWTNIASTVYSGFNEIRTGVFVNSNGRRFYTDYSQCHEENSPDARAWNLPNYSKTGVVPETGLYNFIVNTTNDYFSRREFSVKDINSVRMISFSRDYYAHYNIRPRDGAFIYRNGLILDSDLPSSNNHMYPTDGFAISGHFTDEKTANGKITFSYSGRVLAGPYTFTAEKYAELD